MVPSAEGSVETLSTFSMSSKKHFRIDYRHFCLQMVGSAGGKAPKLADNKTQYGKHSLMNMSL